MTQPQWLTVCVWLLVMICGWNCVCDNVCIWRWPIVCVSCIIGIVTIIYYSHYVLWHWYYWGQTVTAIVLLCDDGNVIVIVCIVDIDVFSIIDDWQYWYCWWHSVLLTVIVCTVDWLCVVWLYWQPSYYLFMIPVIVWLAFDLVTLVLCVMTIVGRWRWQYWPLAWPR